MKIAVASLFDPRDVRSWSGCSTFLLQSLERDQNLSLEVIGPLDDTITAGDRMKRKLNGLRGRNYLPNIMPHHLRAYARQVEEALAHLEVDALLSLDAHPIAYLRTDLPVFYYWDCTFLGNLEYPWFARLAPDCIAAGHDMERRALTRCSRAFLSSDWALATAQQGYGIAPEKLGFVPLAANLDCDRTAADVERLIAARDDERIDLIFIGIDWLRKGGDLALDVVRELNRRGYPARLTVVGCEPEIDGPLPDFVEKIGFLDKRNPDDADRLNALIGRSHFLLVPSLAESFGCVFAEANSFGTPALGRRVGGIDAAIRNGSNGWLFDPQAPSGPYCDYIIALMQDRERYRELARSSYREFTERLTWKAATSILVARMEEALANDKATT